MTITALETVAASAAKGKHELDFLFSKRSTWLEVGYSVTEKSQLENN